MDPLSRRNMFAFSTAGAVAAAASIADAASFGNPDQPPEGAVNATNPNADEPRTAKSWPCW